jgi:subtilase family serine protease
MQKPAGSKTKYEIVGEGRVGVTGCNQGTGYAEGMDVTDQINGGGKKSFGRM